jgi:uncharacterized membrane-anchored protein YitT (DUF2179 family)
MQNTNKRPASETAKEWAMIFLGTTICGTATFFFMMPSHLAVAGVTGLAVVLHSFIPLSVSMITMVCNVLCIILALFLLGKDFSGKTIAMSIYYPLVLDFWEHIFPNMKSVMGDQFLDLICYLFCVSLGLAILFLRNASTGGLDIITMILNKYLGIDMGKAMTTAGMLISFSSFLVYDVKTGVLSVLGTYLNGMVLDHFIFGMNSKKKICIVSEHIDEIRDFVINDMHSGATIYKAIGAFDRRENEEIEVIVTEREYSKLMDYIASVDDSAFVTVYTVNEVKYRPKPKLDKRV